MRVNFYFCPLARATGEEVRIGPSTEAAASAHPNRKKSKQMMNTHTHIHKHTEHVGNRTWINKKSAFWSEEGYI